MSLIASFILALFISLSCFRSYRSNGSPFYAFALPFLVLSLAGLASQFWIIPFGFVLWGVSWVPLILMQALFACLLIIISPSTKQSNTSGNNERAVGQRISITKIFVWHVWLFLLVAIVIGFYNLSVYR